MSHDSAKPPKDPKTELEDSLVQKATEPWQKVLDPEEQDGMRIFVELFVKTHPVMQAKVNRRLKRNAVAQIANEEPDLTPLGNAQSGVVAKGRDTETESSGGEETGVPQPSDMSTERVVVDESGAFVKGAVKPEQKVRGQR